MKTKSLIPILGCVILYACSPIVSTTRSNVPPLEDNQEVLVLDMSDAKPQNAINLGEVKIASAGATKNCTYEEVLEMAKNEARKNGGNVLKIVEHMFPLPEKKCHSIRALILKVDDPKNYKPVEEEIIQNADYAIFKVYMPNRSGAIVSYNLLLGDSVICSVKNNSRAIVYIKKNGPVTLNAFLEAQKTLPINIKFGKTYYLRCGLNEDKSVMQPVLDLMDAQTGEAEFESINAEIQ